MNKIIDWWKVRSKSQKIWLVVGLLFLIGGIDSIFQKPVDTSKKNEPTTSTQQASTPAAVKAAIVFDVPSLLGKNIDQVKQALGAPSDDTEPTSQQLKLGTKEWDKTFTKENKELLVTYRTSDRSVVDFFLTNPNNTDNSTTEIEKQTMLDQLNVTTSASRYKAEFVKALKDPSIVTGLKITPN